GIYTDLEYGPSLILTTLGRFSTSDFSTKVFSQKLDGFSANFNYSAVELTLTAGTTAFMFADTGNILTDSTTTIMSKTDATQNSNTVSLYEYILNNDSVTLLDNPRAVQIATFTLPELVLKQSFTFSFVAQEDLRTMISALKNYSGATESYELLQAGEETYYANKGGAVNTQYFGAGISGSFLPMFYHNIFYYFGTGSSLSYLEDSSSSTGYSYQYTTIISHMAGFTIDYFMPSIFNSRISLGVVFGTGDSDATSYYEGNTEGYYNQFTAITSGGGGLIFTPGVSNIISGSLSYSIKPFQDLPLPVIDNMQIALSYLPFFRIVDGPTSVSEISSSYSGNYLGSEIDLGLYLRPFSDLGASLQLGYFIPKSDAFAGSDLEDPSFLAKLNVSLSY
ncbi:MAG: hypothetical protein PQJ46_06025, partial [Spirochaetales bacterium]|nr:hypothetical protein [Spirochaetales bacterium]